MLEICYYPSDTCLQVVLKIKLGEEIISCDKLQHQIYFHFVAFDVVTVAFRNSTLTHSKLSKSSLAHRKKVWHTQWHTHGHTPLLSIDEPT